jgi:hypothetical protein
MLSRNKKYKSATQRKFNSSNTVWYKKFEIKNAHKEFLLISEEGFSMCSLLLLMIRSASVLPIVAKSVEMVVMPFATIDFNGVSL